ncbi:hypothetical protein N2152v2_001658 [Parachlorella kessleri]
MLLFGPSSLAPQRLLRIKPATFLEAREAAKAGWGMEELVGPGNIKEVQAAAEEAGTDIGVHLYLFQHYGDPWGWEPEDAEDLQGLVASLGPHLQLRGLMTHLNGYQDSDKPALIQRFLSLSCPLAASLAPKGRRLALHFADSSEVLRLLGRGGRMELPQGLCGPDPLAESHLGLPESYGLPSSSTVEGKLPLSRRGEGCRAPTNVEWWARVGRLCYGTDPAVNAGPLGGGVKPVMRWSAAVSQLSWEEVVGHRRLIATVDLSGSTARYPAPGWWAGADAYTASSLNGLAQPEAFVCIHGQQFRLAAVPRGEGRLLRVDVTGAGREVRPGDTVWLLGEGRGLKSLGDEMGADEYNVALCLRGEPPVEGSDWWPPMCCGTF